MNLPMVGIFVTLLLGYSLEAMSETNQSSAPGQLVKAQIARLVANSTDSNVLRKGNTAFALDLYHAFQNDKQNIFFSPYSVTAVMAMVYGGTKGSTQSQLAKGMHFTLPQSRLHGAMNALDQELSKHSQDPSAFQLRLANSIWAQSGFPFLESYLNLLAQSYGAGIHKVDFASNPNSIRLDINNWVASKTNNKIQDLLPSGSIDASNRMVLTNAVYFKAKWSDQFTPSGNKAFKLLDKTSKQVPMITVTANLEYGKGSDYEYVSIPYYENEASMIILAPLAGQFKAFEKSMSAAKISSILTHQKRIRVRLEMPKFTFDTSLSVGDILKKFGIIAAFGPKLADFSGMDGRKDLFISAVLQKAFIAVDEKGTEAAAATAAMVRLTSMPSPKEPPLKFKVDRPFIFFIRHKATGTILFMGKVVAP